MPRAATGASGRRVPRGLGSRGPCGVRATGIVSAAILVSQESTRTQIFTDSGVLRACHTCVSRAC